MDCRTSKRDRGNNTTCSKSRGSVWPYTVVTSHAVQIATSFNTRRPVHTRRPQRWIEEKLQRMELRTECSRGALEQST